MAAVRSIEKKERIMSSSGRLIGVIIAQAVAILVLLGLLLLRSDETHGVQPPSRDSAPEDGEVARPAALTKPPTERSAREIVSPTPTDLPASPAALETLVFGRITGADGEPLKTWISFTAGNVRSVAEARDAGRFALYGLQPGTYATRVTKDGYHTHEGTMTLRATAEPQRYDVQLTKALMILVRAVLPDGRSIKELPPEELGPLGAMHLTAIATRTPRTRLPLCNLAMVERWNEDSHFIRMQYGTNGWVQPPRQAIGELDVRIELPFYVTVLQRQTPLGSALVTEPVDAVDVLITLDALRQLTARVTVRVIDGVTQEPLIEGRVALNDRQSGGGGSRPDIDGKVVFERVVPGLLVLAPSFKGYENGWRYVRVPHGGDVDLGTVALQPQAEISGRVHTLDGQGVNAAITYRNLDAMTFPQPLDLGIGHESAADGTFRMNGLGRGRHLLIFRNDALALTATLVDTSQGSVNDVDVSLVAGANVAFDRHCDPGLLLQIEDSGGLILYSGFGGWPVSQRLASGTYMARLFDDLALVASIPFAVGNDDMTVVVSP